MNALRWLIGLGLLMMGPGDLLQATDKKIHVAIVIGTHHYSPQDSMPLFASELERFGIEVSLIRGEGDPEKKTTSVLQGWEKLDDADLAVFFMRFLQLPNEEWQYLERFIRSGKPVVGLRTANHSFKYPEGHPRFEWNVGFGTRVLGTPYIVHQQGKTDVKVVASNADHPVLENLSKSEWVSPGSLYLTRLQPGVVPLLNGLGKGRARIISREFGVVSVNEIESDVVAWTWENEWGAKVFATSLGHPGDFAEPDTVRLLLNAICWCAGRPPLKMSEPVNTWHIEHKRKK